MGSSVARVLVVSDTHVRDGTRLPTAVLELADRADHVLHAGDLVDVDVLDVLGALAPVTAVLGNCDDAGAAARLESRAIVEIAGVRCALVHDAGAAHERHERLRSWFPEVGLIAYGHTHDPEVVRCGSGAWIVNPGSPTQRRRAPTCTVAWAELSGGEVRSVDLVHVDG